MDDRSTVVLCLRNWFLFTTVDAFLFFQEIISLGQKLYYLQ